MFSWICFDILLPLVVQKFLSFLCTILEVAGMFVERKDFAGPMRTCTLKYDRQRFRASRIFLRSGKLHRGIQHKVRLTGEYSFMFIIPLLAVHA